MSEQGPLAEPHGRLLVEVASSKRRGSGRGDVGLLASRVSGNVLPLVDEDEDVARRAVVDEVLHATEEVATE